MTLKRTPLYEKHETLGAHFTDFGGWDMPLRYASELEEHHAVRESAGIFDLSHMGEILVEGPESASFLNTALAGNMAIMRVGRAKYSVLLNEQGGIIDDLIAYRLSEDRFLVVPNAGNAAEVFAEFEVRAKGFDVNLKDETSVTSLIAVQGPNSVAILKEIMGPVEAEKMADMKYYSVIETRAAKSDVLLARTGYTGEDGFELYVANDDAPDLWDAVKEAGERHGAVAAGLAARDSLRLEAGMPLYGNELGVEIMPQMAGLAPIVSFKKEEIFVGRTALEGAPEPARVLVGLKGLGRRAGRSGYAVLKDGEVVGEITSGQPSPTLKYPIALAYVDRAAAEVGTSVEVDLRGKPQPYEVVELPFYKRS